LAYLYKAKSIKPNTINVENNAQKPITLHHLPNELNKKAMPNAIFDNITNCAKLF